MLGCSKYIFYINVTDFFLLFFFNVANIKLHPGLTSQLHWPALPRAPVRSFARTTEQPSVWVFTALGSLIWGELEGFYVRIQFSKAPAGRAWGVCRS